MPRSIDGLALPPLEALDIPLHLWGALARAAVEAEEREAVVAEDGSISYGQLHRKAMAVARALVAAGIRRGDHVAVCAGNSVEWVTLFYGIARAGGVCVPVNTRLAPPEIADQLARADARLLFLTPSLLKIDFLAVIRQVCPGIETGLPDPGLPLLGRIVILGDHAPAAAEPFATFLKAGEGSRLPTPPAPGDMALIQFTSGSTSAPKPVQLTHKNMTTDAYYVGRRMGVRPGDRFLSARPFFHVAGSTLSVVLSAVHGATLVTMTRFTGEGALALIEKERCTLTSGNDTMFLMMLNSPDFDPARHRLRGGWAAASPGVMRRIVEGFGAAEIVTGYGLSEASPNIATSDFRDPVENRLACWMRVHPGLELRIADPATGQTLPPGATGEIQVSGWCVMAGYYRDSGATAAAILPDGFLRTGDLGVLSPDGRLGYRGRLKEIIRVGGENVSPSEIEDVLHEHPDIRMAQVCALPDPRLIEVPCAHVVPRTGASLDAEAVTEWLRPRLAGFKLPRYVAVIDSFDAIGINAAGKVPKRLLAEDGIRRFGLTETGERA